MASATKEFLIKLFLDSDTKGGDKAKKSLETLQNTIKATSEAGTKMSLAITAPLVAFATLGIRSAANFEQQMARVGAVSNATAEELKALEVQARKLGETTRFSASEAADAMAFLSMAGFNSQQTMAAMPSTLKLASAAMLDMGTAADITSNILTGFGMQVGELGHVNDVLVKAFTSSNTNLQQLGNAMKYVAPTAAGANQSIEDVVATLGALGNAGIQGSMAGTTLRGAMSQLLNPTTATAKILKSLNVNTRTSTGEMRSLITIIGNLADSGVQTSQVMEMFGDKAGPGMVALLGQGSDVLEKFSENLENSAGTAEDVAKRQEESLMGAWREIKSAYEEMQISLMQAGVFDALKALLKLGKDLILQFNALGSETKRTMLVYGSLAAALGPVLLAGSKLIGVIALLNSGFLRFTTSLLSGVKVLKSVELGSIATRSAIIALRTAFASIGIGLAFWGIGAAIDYVAQKSINATNDVDNFNESLSRLNPKEVVDAWGNMDSVDWGKHYDLAIEKSKEYKKEVDKYTAQIAVIQKELLKQKSITDSLYDSKKFVQSSDWNNSNQEQIKLLKQLEQLEWQRSKPYEQLKSERLKVLEADKMISARQNEVNQAQEKALKKEQVLRNSIAQIEKQQSEEALSNADKLSARKMDLLNVDNSILKIQEDINSLEGEDHVSKRITLLEALRQKLDEQISLKNEVAVLDKSSLADEEKRSKLKYADDEFAILSAKSKGQEELAKQLQRQLDIEKLTLQLRKDGMSLDDAQTRAKATLEANEKLAQIQTLSQLEKLKTEAKLAGLQAQGKIAEAERLALQIKASEFAEKYKISYTEALNTIKEIDKLQSPNKVEYSETQKKKAQAIVDRGEGGSVGKKTMEQAQSILEGKSVEGNMMSVLQDKEATTKSPTEPTQSQFSPQPITTNKSLAANSPAKNSTSMTPSKSNNQEQSSTSDDNANGSQLDSKMLETISSTLIEIKNFMKDLSTTQNQLSESFENSENYLKKLDQNISSALES